MTHGPKFDVAVPAGRGKEIRAAIRALALRGGLPNESLPGLSIRLFEDAPAQTLTNEFVAGDPSVYDALAMLSRSCSHVARW